MTEPIKPSEIKQIIPEFVIKGANECIQKHYHHLDKTSHFTQDELIECILKYKPNEEISKQTLFDNNWLDIEPIYIIAGWEVVYDRPAYYEGYPANFTFIVPKGV